MISDPAARAAELLALVVGADRLEVFAAIALGARTSEQISERSGVDLKRTWQCLRRLENTGVIARSGDEWVVELTELRDAARAGLP
ncbi:MAG: hypothetical protein ABIM89_08395 [Mycobacteriales bacterium]